MNMPARLSVDNADFPARFQALLALKRETAEEVDDAVRAIVGDVRHRGDAAVVDYTGRFDRQALTAASLRIGAGEAAAARAQAHADGVAALAFAAARIEAYHQRQRPQDAAFTDAAGVRLGWRWTPVDSAGLYVPGGSASYPSSVLMNAIPARVAGVRRLVMVVPTPDGVLNPLVMAAADLAGIDEIYRIGGAQAVAALAYGTETIAPVAKIVGPGNAYVAAAKRQVFGQVGIDMIAGPSEVLILADDTANPAWVAADLLAQAEHDPSAQSILITSSAELAEQVERQLASQLATLPRRAVAERSWADNGAIILVPALAEALPLVDRLAPEHLEIMAVDQEALAAAVTHAGAIFIGGHTPEAIGDYVGGSNHVLPTARSARYASGLGVLDFMKRTSILSCDAAALHALGPAAITLGKAEGLHAHARSVAIRLNLPG
jgi:histidinol dehydrogenase